LLDAVVVGSGPNRLAVAWTLAQAGLDVEVFERDPQLGGGMRTDTWGDNYRADWGSAVHPMALASPFFKSVRLADRVEFVVPEASFAHPLPTGAAVAWQSAQRTAADLGRDGRRWLRLVGGLTNQVEALVEGALTSPLSLPARPIAAASLAAATLQGVMGAGLRSLGAQALLAGVVGHTIGRQPALGASAAGAVLLALAHTVGWPIPIGGSQAIADVVVGDLRRWGVRLTTDTHVDSIEDLPQARAYFFDTSARHFLQIVADRVTPGYRRGLARLRAGNAVSKVDFVTSAPIPWRSPEVGLAGSVHLCGTREDIWRAEDEVARGRHAERPMIVLSQPSTFDGTRVPEGMHSIWAYAHVPAGSTVPQTAVIEDAIERYAPGFRDTILAVRTTNAAQIGARNPTMPGGDFASGAVTLRQILARPNLRRAPWLAGDGLYLCSTATFPGPGVHGMAGYGAARHALRSTFA